MKQNLTSKENRTILLSIFLNTYNGLVFIMIEKFIDFIILDFIIRHTIPPSECAISVLVFAGSSEFNLWCRGAEQTFTGGGGAKNDL